MHAEIALGFDKVADKILPILPTSALSVDHPEGRAALVWMIGEYGEVILVLSSIYC